MKIDLRFRSPNYSIRKFPIQFIILHYTAIEFTAAINKLCHLESNVSAHYVIRADGEIFMLVEDQHIAWHAGASYWKNFYRLNEHSIGIELDNLSYTPYPIAQTQSCVNLCNHLVKLHNIPRFNILGHSDIAPDRKSDPGPFFDWSYLATHNLGLWHGLSEANDDYNIMYQFGDRSSNIYKLQQKLQILGYKIESTGIFDSQTNYVVRAFQTHFYPQLITKFGKELYHDDHHLYPWDSVSNGLLHHLLATLDV